MEHKLIRKKHKALSDGNKTLLATICIDLAELYMKEGRYDSAIDEYTTVAETYNDLNNRLDYARANRMVGEAYMQMREFDKAIQHQQIYLDVAKQEDDKLEEQRALATMGHTYLTRFLDIVDNPDKTYLNLAYKAFMKSLQVCEDLSTTISKIEHADMLARLLANLGVVNESQGNYNEGIKLLRKSISICKQHDLFEQLERAYAALGSLYVRKQEYNNAIHYFNLAMEVADRLPGKIELTCTSLVLKAEILIKLADFRAAKSVFLKAHKLKTPNLNERENIKTNLKVVVAMCNAEDSLLIIAENDHKTKKELYEKLGDGSCYLKNYSKAIDYYQKMLQEAELNGDIGKDLSSCYVSLAQTYSDNKNFDKAIEYFQRDHEMCEDNLAESIGSIYGIVDNMELAGKSLNDIRSVYVQAREKCAKVGDKQLEGKVLKRFGDFLRKQNRLQEALGVEKELLRIGYVPSESESEGFEDNNTPIIGQDIDTDDISDSDIEIKTEEGQPRVTRKRTKAFIVKKNNKGETQLHTACIAGNAELVRRLLDQGHPVNIRDNCGWLPIHEACICGHLEIVEMLVDKGAAINDRGGTLCNGITPLHDAASNGHLEVIQYLLTKGASAIAKSDDGETPLHILKNWRTATTLDIEQLKLYSHLVQRMTDILQKSGHDIDLSVTPTKNILSTTHVVSLYRTTQKSPREPSKTTPKRMTNKNSPRKQKIGKARRNLGDDDSDWEETSQKSDRSGAGSEYKRVMLSLRHRTDVNSAEIDRKRKSTETRLPALVNENPDDWLEDDMRTASKKRKTSADDLIYKSNTRNTENKKPLSRNSSKSSENFDPFLDSDFENIVNLEDESEAPKNPKRKRQISLFAAGFERSTSASSVSSVDDFAPVRPEKHQLKVKQFAHLSKTFEADSTVEYQNAAAQRVEKPQILSVDIRIDGKLYRVPVTSDEMLSCTVRWLAEQAANRYFKREGVMPVLELETKNGAILADDDYVSMLFPAGSIHAEELQARVVKRHLPPLTDRYEEACTQMNLVPDPDLKKRLQEISITLDLSDLILRSSKLQPICKAISRQTNLFEINFSGNAMTDECAPLLCSSLPFLQNLTILNVSLNHLTWETLKQISDALSTADTPILQNLSQLDLSHNPLGNQALQHLAVATRYLKLKALNLADVDFDGKIFDLLCNENVGLGLEHLEVFNVSYNGLDKAQLLRFFSWLELRRVKEINASRNRVTDGGLLQCLMEEFKKVKEGLKLNKLLLAGCHLENVELYNAPLLLQNCQNFEHLDLSHNKTIAVDTLKRLIHHSSSSQLNLHGCDKIGFFEENIKCYLMSNATSVKTLTITLDRMSNVQLLNTLKQMWVNKYKNDANAVELVKNVWRFSAE